MTIHWLRFFNKALSNNPEIVLLRVLEIAAALRGLLVK